MNHTTPSWVKAGPRDRTDTKMIKPSSNDRLVRLGVLPYLAARPLISGLDQMPNVELVRARPSDMAALLASGMVDAAMLGPMDVLQFGGPMWILPAGAISSTGPALFARLFAQVRPQRVRTIWADTGATTVVGLAKVLWSMAYQQSLRLIPLSDDGAVPDDAEAMIGVGDRVVTAPPLGFDFQTDLAAMWHRRTGLPFVFALWAAANESRARDVNELLIAAGQDRGDQLEQIAESFGPTYGWPIDLAKRELTSGLGYEMTDTQLDSVYEFADLADSFGIVGSGRSAEISVV